MQTKMAYVHKFIRILKQRVQQRKGNFEKFVQTTISNEDWKITKKVDPEYWSKLDPKFIREINDFNEWKQL